MGGRKHGEARAARDEAKADALQTFDFRGDLLEVVSGAGVAHVVVRRVCEALGVDVSGQIQRLKRDPAICVEMISMQVWGDDQRRDVACIDIRALPLWLATIHPSKVRPEVRAKLVAYKREAAEVLADHFLGPRRILTANVAALQQRVEELETQVEQAERERAAVEVQLQHLQSDAPGVIGRVRAQRWILSILKEAARIHCAAEGDFSEKRFLREFKDRENQVRLHVHFPASLAQRWESLPLAKFGEAQCKAMEIRERERRRSKAMLRELRARVEQLELPIH